MALSERKLIWRRRVVCARAPAQVIFLCVLAVLPTRAADSLAHPILSIPSNNGSAANTVLSTWTEAQYTNSFTPRFGPRNAGYGFGAAVVAGDTGWSWSSSSPTQIVSTPSGTVFPNPNTAQYPIQTQAVTVFTGDTVSAPYYLAAGSSSSKSFVFNLIAYNQQNKRDGDLGNLAGAYLGSGSNPATRNDAYARRIAIALLDWGRWYPDYTLTGKNSASFINTSPSYILSTDLQRASDHNGLAHEWSDTPLQAFDAIYNSVALTNLSGELGFDVRDYIATNVFFCEGDFFVNRVPISVAIGSNLSGPYDVLPEVARVLNRPDYIVWMDSYLTATVTDNINRDGALEEGLGYSIGYLNANVNAAQNTHDYFLTRPATNDQFTAISNRANVYINSLKFGQSQWASVALPNGELSSFGDTPFNKYFTARNAGNSALLSAYGHVSMGAGTSSSTAVQVNQNFSGNENHMRSDTTAFVLWAFNNEYLGNIRYYNGAAGRQFDEQILSHNAITIDRVNETPYPSADTYGNGDITLYEPGNRGLALTEIDGQRDYSGKASRYQRLLLLNSADLNRPYVVDVFRVTGGTNHDYTLHGAILWDQTWQCSFPLVTNPAPYPMLEPGETWVPPTGSGSSFAYYGYWRNVSSNTAPGDFQITYRDANRTTGRDLRLWMTSDPVGPYNVYLGMTPVPDRTGNTETNFINYLNLWRPSAIIRKRVTSGPLQDLFVSVIEPINAGAGTVQSVQRLPMSGSSLEACALKITFTDGRVDTYVINLRNPAVAGAGGGSATVTTADGQYSLTGRVGAFMDGPAGDSRVWTMNATDFQYPGRRLTTPGTYYWGSIAGETRKLNGAAYDAFLTVTPLPQGTALRNRFLSLTHGALSGSGTTGISEMYRIDQVVLTNGLYSVCFTNDHFLEITNGVTSVEQVAPLRTFTGSNAFEIALSAFAGQISPIADQNIPPDGSSGPIPFSFGDLGAASGAVLQVLASSSNPTLVPNGNLSLGGSGTNRTITLTPASGQTGSGTITISVTDGSWTNSRSFNVVVATFFLATTPGAQSVQPGGSAAYTNTVSATNGTGTVSFSATGLPASAAANFNPATFVGAGTNTVTVTTAANTLPGTYPVQIVATAGALSSTSTVALVVTGIAASPGTLFWVGTNNWSSPLNWTNVTAGGTGAPGSANDLVFGDAGTVASSNTVNSVVDTDTTIDSLVFTNLGGFHTLQINPGRTLSIIGAAPGFANAPALNVGLETYPVSANQTLRASITGAGGTLSISNTASSVQVRMGFGTGVVGPLATLDLSGLGTFAAWLNHFQLGVESGVPRRVAGACYLARTNVLTLVQSNNVGSTLTGGNPALYLGHNTQIGVSNGSALYLGVSNSINVNFVVIGRGNQTNNLFAFNPAFIGQNPTARFRASDGLSRVGFWSVGDNSAGIQTTPSSGTNDFSGGSVDALVDWLFLGRGRVGTTANTGVGVLTFDAGTIDVNTLRVGSMVDEATSTNASGAGTINVNGTGLLVVNTALELGHSNTVAPPVPAALAATAGTLNLNGGTVQAANILGAGGTATINLNSGILDLQGGSAVNLTTLNIGHAGTVNPAIVTNAALLSSANPITVASNGVVAGNTVLQDSRLIVNGALSPGGDSIGAMTNTGPVTFGAGRYLFDLADAVGQE